MSFKKFLEKIENSAAPIAIRSGLTSLIPILLIGAICLIFQYFPISAVQKLFAEATIAGKILSILYSGTFGALSIYATISIAASYPQRKEDFLTNSNIPIVLTSLITFSILVGFSGENFSQIKDAFGVKGMFPAIISGTLIPWIYYELGSFFSQKIYVVGDIGDIGLRRSIFSFIPSIIILIPLGLFSAVLTNVFQIESFFKLYSTLLESGALRFARFLGNHGLSYFSGFFFILLSSFLWFFGIHGSNVLEGVMVELFDGAQFPILTRGLFDQFVLMGGCGTSFCLLFAIFIFGKRRSTKQIGKYALPAMIFNINEVLTLGVPVFYNIHLFIPFLLTPIVSYTIAYSAIAFNLVPEITNSVNWTVPILFNATIATGSIRGAILQLVILAVGTLIYSPFVKLNDAAQDKSATSRLGRLVSILQESEKVVTPFKLAELKGELSQAVFALSYDLQHALEKKEIQLYYQGQFDEQGKCFGAEALMRWIHPQLGFIYPPLIVKLASEMGILTELETYVFEKATKDAITICKIAKRPMKISINVLPQTLFDENYMDKVRKFATTTDKSIVNHICLEITEQTALLMNEKTSELLEEIKKLGLMLAIDDFSMGHTSIAYLKENYFDLVKLDGSIVKDCMENDRSQNIISSIVNLSQNLGFNIIAEYVETEAEKELLKGLGCNQYQGWLYGKAEKLDDFLLRF